MKMIAEHPRTRQLLRISDGGSSQVSEVIIVKYFAWKASALLERSMLGLWQGLIHSLLEQCPEIIDAPEFTDWQANDLLLVRASFSKP